MTDTTQAPSFDRRSSDANVAALSTRMRAVEDRLEQLELNTKANAKALEEHTELTKEVHEAVFGVQGEFAGLATMTRDVHTAVFGAEGKPGVQDTIQAIYGLVETGKSFFGFINRNASRAGRASDWISRTIKRFWWLILIAGSIATYLKTGKWEMPIWPQ